MEKSEIKNRLEKLRKLDPKVMSIFSSLLRGMLIASPGHELFCADFAAIELNIAFWVADHREGLKAIAEKRKLYEEMASATFGIPVDKVAKESLERFIGKETVLGSQYGMGWSKLLKTLHAKGKKEITASMCKKAISTYRRVHSPIPETWSNLERCIVQAVKHPKRVYELNRVVIQMNGDWLDITLPSGRPLRYYKPRISTKVLAGGRMVPQIHYWAADAKFGWVETIAWGGIFFNHIVQGISRDLMANGMVNIEDGGGYRFLLSVHDEALAEAPIGKGDLKEFIGLMTNLPYWAKGAIVNAEGWVGQRYRK